MTFPQISPKIIEDSEKLTALQMAGAQQATIEKDGWYLDNRLLPMQLELAEALDPSVYMWNNNPLFGDNNLLFNNPERLNSRNASLEIPQIEANHAVAQSNELMKQLAFDGNEAITLDVNAAMFATHPEDFIVFMESMTKYTNFISALRSSQAFDYSAFGQIGQQFWPMYKLQVQERPTFLHMSPLLYAKLSHNIAHFAQTMKKLSIAHKPMLYTNSLDGAYGHLSQSTADPLISKRIATTRQNIDTLIKHQ